MLTDRGKWLLGTAAIFYALSRAFGVDELGIAAVSILALVGLAIAFTRLMSAQLAARRAVHPTRLFHDAEGTVEVQVRNLGRLPTALLQIDDAVPHELADRASFLLAPLAPDKSAGATYTIHGRQRGRYEVGPLTVRLRDPFGIAQRTSPFSATDAVTVYPPVWRLPEGVPLSGRVGTGAGGRLRPLPSGDEFSNVREYVRGDDLRKVHWRSTAHRGKVMIRQDEAPQQPTAALILDTRRGAHHGVGATSSFEAAVATAASVTYHLSAHAFDVRLLTGPVAAPPRPVPWEFALEQLAVVETVVAAELGALWQQVSQGVAGDGLLVAVTAVPEANDLRAMVRAGRGFGSRAAVLIDTPTFVRNRTSHQHTEATVLALRAAGWRVTVLRGGERLEDRWRELLLFQRATVGA